MTRKQAIITVAVIFDVVFVGLLVAAYFLGWFGGGRVEPVSDVSLATPAKGFVGSSKDLKRTVIVPTLDTPIPEGMNAIWCGSFQLAWNRLAQDVIHAPPDIANAEEVVKQLNSASITEGDVPADGYYAVAGFVKDNIVEKIQSEMQRRFQMESRIDFDISREAIIAYAYLQASVPFTIPFFDNDEELQFQKPDGTQLPVAAFGIRYKDQGIAAYSIRKQVEVLSTYSMPKKPWETTEFIIDPCRTSSPNQIILAILEPKDTLAATWDEVNHRIKDFPTKDKERNLAGPVLLLIPNLDWDISHHFTELEGIDKSIHNSGFEEYWCQEAIQMIRFKLDRSGAELKSESVTKIVTSTGRRYVFDQPFLISIRKRENEQPFFVMWVANSELLMPFKPEAAR
jgi:hypothetical protein